MTMRSFNGYLRLLSSWQKQMSYVSLGKSSSPKGVTLLALLAESHASIHTWPCERYCAIDLYTCGTKTETHKAAEFLKTKLKAQECEQKEIERKVFRDS
jgi:S-adenosylmethionine decarboxylase proenzyme